MIKWKDIIKREKQIQFAINKINNPKKEEQIIGIKMEIMPLIEEYMYFAISNKKWNKEQAILIGIIIIMIIVDNE